MAESGFSCHHCRHTKGCSGVHTNSGSPQSLVVDTACWTHHLRDVALPMLRKYPDEGRAMNQA